MDVVSPIEANCEPARKSLAVNFLMAAASFGVGRGSYTPHLSGGRPRDKILYEYNGAPAFVERLREFVDIERILRGKTVLDVGCGWGGKTAYFVERLGATRIHGFDLPGDWLVHAEAFAQEAGIGDSCTFSIGRAESMEFDSGLFDVLLCEDVLEHVQDPIRVLSECRRVLKPGGLLVAKFPSFRALTAHHLDRATTLPGIHLILSMRTLASGLNWLRENRADKFGFEPIRRVIETPYGVVTSDLNGMGFSAFARVLQSSGLESERLELVPAKNFGGRKFARLFLAPIYRVLFAFSPFREFLSSFILVVARKR